MMKSGIGYSSVPSNRRVQYCQIVSGATLRDLQVPINTNCYSAVLSDTTPGHNDAANWFTVFYLPWGGGKTFRITLKNRQQNMQDPDIFITSEVNGCSVFVEGSRAEPTVYHVNNSGGTSPTSGSLQPAWDNFFAPKQQRMTDWVEDVPAPKSIRQDPTLLTQNPPKAVHARNYMDLVHTHRPTDSRTPRGDVRTEIKGKHQQAKKITITKTIYAPCGTVFGIRENGEWTFYYQRKATMFFMWNATRGFLKKKITKGQAIARQYVIDCEEFWPGGGGSIYAGSSPPMIPDDFFS